MYFDSCCCFLGAVRGFRRSRAEDETLGNERGDARIIIDARAAAIVYY